MRQLRVKRESPVLKPDFGCGPHPREGFEGVDRRDSGQRPTADRRKPWPWKDASVSEAHTSHFVEHLTVRERIYFRNELYRELVADRANAIQFWNVAAQDIIATLTER